MKYLLIIIVSTIVIIAACTADQTPGIPWRPEFYDWKYTTNISIDGVETEKYLEAVSGPTPHFLLDFFSSLPDYSYYYKIGMSISPDESGTFTLQPIAEEKAWVYYSEVCCFGTPDQINWTYYIYDDDSLNNYVRIHADSITHELSGMFKCTMVRMNEPFDTIHIECDTFYCTYTIL